MGVCEGTGVRECNKVCMTAVMSSVDIGDDPVGHSAAVRLPSRAVLRSALTFISCLPVHQQHAEVQHVEVRQDVGEPCGDTVGVTNRER